MTDSARDLLFALALFACGGLVLLEVRNVPPPLFEAFGGEVIPRIAAWILAALAVSLLARGAFRLSRDGAATGMGRAALRPDPRLLGTIGILALQAAAIEWGGTSFLAATIPSLFLLFLLLGGVRPRFVVAALALSVVVAIALHLLFTRVFRIDLP